MQSANASASLLTGAIEFRDVTLTVPATPSRVEGVAVPHRILDGVTLRVAAGTTVALLGRSGSGKTSLLRSVNGLTKLTSGSVLVGGVNVETADVLQLRRSIGYVIQDTGLYPHMTVERNVSMALELASRPLQERKSRAAALLTLVGLPTDQFARRMPHELSGGQRQRVGVARALAADPAILLMDEPFGALDPLTRSDMQMLLRQLLRRLRDDSGAATTALIVTHDLQEAVFLAQRVLFIDGGRVAADLAADAVLTSTEPIVQEYVRAAQRYQDAG